MAPLHPSIVHFPIVLLFAAAGLYVASLFTRKLHLEVIAFIFHAIGLLSCILAIFTGDFEADKIVANASISDLIERHEYWMTICTYGFGLLGIWAFLRQKTTLKFERVAFAVTFLTLFIVAGLGARLGGELVFVNGVGVIPMQEQLEQAAKRSDSIPTTPLEK